MDNFVKTTIQRVANAVFFEDADIKPERALVVVGKTKTAYVVKCKCRNTDKLSVLKCLTKAYFAELKTQLKHNNSEAVKASKNSARAIVRTCLSGHTVYVTDKNGNLIESSRLSVVGQTINERLSDLFNVSKSEGTLYDLFITQGKTWEDEKVITALLNFAKAAEEHLTYCEDLDIALEDAADSTEKEQKAAEEATEKRKAAGQKAAETRAKRLAEAKAAKEALAAKEAAEKIA